MHIVNWLHANQCILNMDITNIVKFTTNNGTSHSLSFEYASKLLTEIPKFKFLDLCIINLIGRVIQNRLFPN
jgi:hypothetical protein